MEICVDVWYVSLLLALANWYVIIAELLVLVILFLTGIIQSEDLPVVPN